MRWYFVFSLLWVLSAAVVAQASITGIPEIEAAGWTQKSPGIWSKEDDISELLTECQKAGSDYWSIELPILIQGVHEIYLDGRLLEASGDKSFRRVSNVYGTLAITCPKLQLGKKLTWKRYTTVPVAAHAFPDPVVRHGFAKTQFFVKAINLLSIGGLFFVVLVLLLFRKSIPRKLLFLNFTTIVSFAAFLSFLTPEFFPITVSAATAQKICDVGIWVGFALIFSIFYEMGLTSRGIKVFALYSLLAVTVAVILAPNQNVGQIVSNFGMAFAWVPIVITWLINFRRSKYRMSMEHFPILLTWITASNDMLMYFYPGQLVPIFPLGLMCSYMLIVLSLSKRMMALSAREAQLDEIVSDLSLINDALLRGGEFEKHCLKSEYSKTLADWTVQLRKELREKQDWILSLSRSATRGALIDQVIHDLKTPISALQLFGKHLKLDAMEEKVFKGALDRLCDITSSLRRSEMEGTLRSSTLRDSLRGVLVECKWLARHYQFALDWVWPEEKLDTPILIDHSLLARSIENLVRNSIESIEEKRKLLAGSVDPDTIDHCIRVEILREDFALQINVSDTGVGLASNQSSAIGHSSTKGSSGIGLTVVRGFCEKNGGRFVFAEKPSEGFSTEAQLKVISGVGNA